MNSQSVQRRRLGLLRKLVRQASYRTDSTILLSDIGELTRTHNEIVDACDETAKSDLSYDLNHLKGGGYLYLCHQSYTQDSRGQSIGDKGTEAVKVTDKAIERVTELERPFVMKALDKQPATVVSVAVIAFQIIWTIALAIWTWSLTLS
jgi:hypothetical protein